jgi:LacI family transcriptional regulator
LDSTLEEASPIGFIIQNSFQSGYLAAKLLDFGSKENSHILVIHVTKELENAHHLLLREEGFMEYFKEHPKKYQHIFRIEISDGKMEISKKLEGLGLLKEQIDAVFVTSSQVHLAVDF